MNDAKQVEVPLSKQKLFLMLIGSIIFVTIGFWFLISPPKISNPVLGNPVLIAITGLGSILFFGLGIFIFIKKLSDKSPGLIITGEGFTDNSSGVSAGFVSWRDLLEIKETVVFNQKLLMFIVKNPENYINRQPNPLKRKAMEVNYKSFGSPISVSANGLECDFNELKTLLDNKFHDFKIKK